MLLLKWFLFPAFGFHAGWEQPHFFATKGELKTTPICYTRKHYHDAVGREVDLILNGVGVADLTPFGKFILEGPGATKFLSSMVANTLPKVCKWLYNVYIINGCFDSRKLCQRFTTRNSLFFSHR